MLTIAPARALFALPSSLEGTSVLLADDGNLAGDLEMLLWEAGATVLLAHNAYQAELIAGSHDLGSAVLDAELGADTIARITSCLALRAVPYVLVSPSPELPGGLYRPHDMLAMLERLEQQRLH